jgi:hypothetical protein
MRYILIEKNDAAGVLKIIYHNSCQKKIQKEKKNERREKIINLCK